MMLIELTTVPPEAVPVAQFKDHLRLGSGFAEDAVQDGLLEAFLRAAIAAIEARTGKVLVTRDFSLTQTQWRDASRQTLPLAPVVSVQSVTLVSGAGAETVLPASAWRLDGDIQRPAVTPVAGLFPGIPQGGSVRILFSAGYGAAFADLPADLAQAVMMLASHFYEFRHEAAYGAGAMPFGVTALIERYRTIRTFGGGRT